MSFHLKTKVRFQKAAPYQAKLCTFCTSSIIILYTSTELPLLQRNLVCQVRGFERKQEFVVPMFMLLTIKYCSASVSNKLGSHPHLVLL